MAADFPEYLYRFRPANTSYFADELNAVFSQKMYLAKGDWMNDPFDIRPSYEPSSLASIIRLHKKAYGNQPILTKERMEELEGKKFSRSEYRQLTKGWKPGKRTAQLELKTCQKVVDELPKKARLACLSEVQDNIPMWAHYADNHRGICIQYRLLPHRIDVARDPAPLKVDYVNERPVINTEDIFKYSGRGHLGKPSAADSLKVFEAMYLTKSLSWAYEQEWRVFEHTSADAGYRQIPSLEPISISLGISASDLTCENLIRIVEGRVSIHKLSTSAISFGFVRSKIA